MKKVVSVLLSLLLVCGFCLPASAAGSVPSVSEVIQIARERGSVPRSLLLGQTAVESIQPLGRYAYVNFVAASFVIEDGTAYCGGIVSVEEGRDFDYRIQLQKKSGSNWTTVKTLTHSGSEYDSAEDSYTLTQSGEYRSNVTAYVKNSNGAYVEVVSCASGSEYYSK